MCICSAWTNRKKKDFYLHNLTAWRQWATVCSGAAAGFPRWSSVTISRLFLPGLLPAALICGQFLFRIVLRSAIVPSTSAQASRAYPSATTLLSAKACSISALTCIPAKFLTYRERHNNCKLQMAGEPDDDTKFGLHANPGIGSHFGQTKFLVIYPASLAKIRKNKKPLNNSKW